MKNKNLLLTTLATILLASYFVIAGFSSAPSKETDKSTCCSQKMKNCNIKTNSEARGEMMLENLSRQFLSIPLLSY